MESILDLAPDLVVLYAHRDGIEMADRLTRSGIPTVVIKPETFDSIRETMHILGAALDRQARAEEVIRAMDGILEQVSTRTSGMPPKAQKRVYYAAPRGFLSTVPADMLQDEIIRMAGGINVASHLHGYFKNVSVEHLIEWQPEVILASRSIRYQALEMLERPVLSNLPAVQTGNVYVFPSNLTPWDYPSPLSALGVLWLAGKMYPQHFVDIPIMEAMDAFHDVLFGKPLSQIGGLLDDGLPGKTSPDEPHPVEAP
jgi:iron complex transport system substrate-binding protein